MPSRPRLLASLLAFSVFASTVTPAATEFENGVMPLELGRLLTGGAIYRSLPDGFPVVALPAGTDVRVLGSMVRLGLNNVVLSTSGNVETLRLALVAAYKAAGWIELPNASGLTRLCDNARGILSFTAELGGYNGLRLLHAPASVPLDCAALATAGNSNSSRYFMALLPVLTLPPGATVTSPASTSLYTSFAVDGGARAKMERSAEIRVSGSNIASIYAHFAARLAEQGWHLDTEDSGMRSAMSVWFSTAPPPEGFDVPDTELTGFVTILHNGGDDYSVKFAAEASTDARMNDYYTVTYGVTGNGQSPQIGIRGLPPVGLMP